MAQRGGYRKAYFLGPWIRDYLIKAREAYIWKMWEDHIAYRKEFRFPLIRYLSFARYFYWYEQLGWVERVREEVARKDDIALPDITPRHYYRVTPEGLTMPEDEWRNPLVRVHPEHKSGERRRRARLEF